MLVIEVPREDENEVLDLNEKISNCEVVYPKRFEGGDAVVQILVPIASAVLPPLVQFLLDRIRSKKRLTTKHKGTELKLSEENIESILTALLRDKD